MLSTVCLILLSLFNWRAYVIDWCGATCILKLKLCIPSRQQSPFHFKLWLLLTVQNWVLDFGRPLFALVVSELFPLSRPHIGELIWFLTLYVHTHSLCIHEWQHAPVMWLQCAAVADWRQAVQYHLPEALPRIPANSLSHGNLMQENEIWQSVYYNHSCESDSTSRHVTWMLLHSHMNVCCFHF